MNYIITTPALHQQSLEDLKRNQMSSWIAIFMTSLLLLGILTCWGDEQKSPSKSIPQYFDPSDPKCYRIITNGKEWRIQVSGYSLQDISNWIWLDRFTGIQSKKRAKDILAKEIKEAKEGEEWVVED